MSEEGARSMAEQFEEVHTKLSEVDQTLDGMADEIDRIVNEAMSETAATVSYDLDDGSIHAHLPVDKIVSRLNQRLDPPFFVDLEQNELIVRDVRQVYDIDESDISESKSRRELNVSVKELIGKLEDSHGEGAPIEKTVYLLRYLGMEEHEARHQIKKLKQKGEVYEPRTDHLRTT